MQYDLTIYLAYKYGIMTEELVIREIRIKEAAGQGNSDSRMTSFEVIMPLKLLSAVRALLWDEFELSRLVPVICENEWSV